MGLPRWRRKRRPVVIGQQVADARAAEQEHRESHPDLVSPLAGVRYDAAENDLLQLVDSPKDDVVEALIHRFAAADRPERADLRAALTADDLYTLISFARRSAVRTLLRHDGGPARLGMLALEQMIDTHRVDHRDVLWAAGIVRHALDRMDGVPTDDLRTKWMMTEVRFPDGRIGLTGIGRGPAAGSIDPIAVGLAVQGMLGAEGYLAEGLTPGGEVPSVWLPAPSRPGIEALLGRSRAITQVGARLRGALPFEHVFLCWLVELADEADGPRWDELWADPAPRDHAVLTVRVARLAALFVVTSSRAGTPNPETDRSLARWAEPVRAILTGV